MGLVRPHGGSGPGKRRPHAWIWWGVGLYADGELCRLSLRQAQKKDTGLDVTKYLNKYLDKAVRVRFQGGREGELAPAG